MFQRSLLKHLIYFILLTFVLVGHPAYSFVHSMSDQGHKIKWADNVSSISFYFDSDSQTFSSTGEQNSVNQALLNSIAEWNTTSTLNISSTRVTNQSNLRNDIYFDQTGFLDDTNILGVTQVIYETASGEIVEADIVLNDSINLNLIENDSFFIGNVLAHELGHALGLAHSEVGFSSMFYLASNGQFDLAQDDKSAVATLYGKNAVNMIRGKVVGGGAGDGLFGIHVIVFDASNGKIEASTITNQNGRFTIRDLDPNKDYTILTSPIKNKSVMPKYYKNISNDFCIGQVDFQKTFWQGCGASDEGHPVSLMFNDEEIKTIDVGEISVRCNLDTPTDYSLDRNTVDGYHLRMNRMHNRFVGLMTLNDVKFNNKDIISIDLSNDNLPAVEAGEQLYLDISIANQELYSMLKLQAKVIFPNFSEATFGATDITESDYTFNSDIKFRLSLTPGVSDNNSFKFEINGRNFKTIQFGETTLAGYINDSNLGSDLDEFFPDHGNLSEQSLFYLFNARLIKETVEGEIIDLADRAESFTRFDNSSCVDAPLSYKTFPFAELAEIGDASAVTTTNEEEDLTSAIGGCGTIGGPNPPSRPGNSQFLFSLMLGMMLALLSRFKYRRF